MTQRSALPTSFAMADTLRLFEGAALEHGVRPDCIEVYFNDAGRPVGWAAGTKEGGFVLRATKEGVERISPKGHRWPSGIRLAVYFLTVWE